MPRWISILLTLTLSATFISAQEVITLSKENNNRHIKNSQKLKVLSSKEIKLENKSVKKLSEKFSNANAQLDLIDTLFTVTNPYDPGSYSSNFGFFGQDYMVQWFKAPVDLYLREVGFSFYSADPPVADLEMKVISCTIPIDSLQYLYDELWGFYQSPIACNDSAAAFFDTSGSGWVNFNGHSNPIGYDIWSDQGVGYTFTPIIDSTGITYQFIDLDIPGYPEIPAGTVFGVVLKNTAPLDESRVGLRGTSVGTGGQNQNSLFKFYCEQYFPLWEIDGWWSRDVTLGYAAVVEYCEILPPIIDNFTIIPSGTNLGPFTIDAAIISLSCFPPFYVEIDSAKIKWSIDEGMNWNDVHMTNIDSSLWRGEIPVQSPNTKVYYQLFGYDENGGVIQSSEVWFYVFGPSGAATLVIFNGFNDASGYPQDYYFGPNVYFDHDAWAYGKIYEVDLLNNYNNIFEIWNEISATYNDSLITLWLAGNSNRNYFLAGQEWLGFKNGFVDSDYVAGDFEYDVLGVTHSYNDISYNGAGQYIPTLVMPEAATLLGQPLVNLFNSLTPPADSMMYNPTFITGNPNWQDAFDAVSGVEVDMTVETRGIQGVTNVDSLPTLSHRILPSGNKIVFASYNPIALTTAVDDNYPYYYWVGYDTSNSVYQALKWFGIVTEVKEPGSNTPLKFSLSQNYPNPFNPVTKIKFTVGANGNSPVQLIVYDVLGREVATLVNEEKPAGTYEVEFDASSLSSGVYFYQLKAGNYIETKKMILLK